MSANSSPNTKYKSLTQIEHVKERPNLYIGSVVPVKRDAFLWDPRENKMVYTEGVPFCEGLVKIMDEAIDNAIDNSIQPDDPTTIIKVSLTDREFSVKNNGRHIPIDPMQDKPDKLIPHVIFGECLSGSNFNDNRDSIGANGLGIKLANIMSDNFSVVCYDKSQKRSFYGTWIHGMTKLDRYKTVSTKKEPLMVTEVSFRPTLSRFNNNPELKLKSIVDMTPWIQTRLIQLACTHPNHKLKVYFNNTLIKVRDFKGYMKCFPSKHTFYANPKPDFEYGVSVSTTGAYEHQSFVNCQYTPSPNSTHTKYVTNAVVRIIREYLSNKHRGATLTPSAITAKLNIFVNMRLKNPGFTSQTKIELSSPISSSQYPIEKGYVLGVLKKSGVIKELEDMLNNKVISGMAKVLNGTKARNVTVEKYDSAHASGTKQSKDCTLFIVEGDSAKTMVTTGMSVIGRKFYGVFPVRGKFLNVRGASPTVLKGNKEVQNIMKILGLNFSKKYETWQDRETLRYGKLCVLTDADVDGHHICGLLINFIMHFWPALAEHFFVRFVTPIIKVSRANKQSKHFFNLAEFEQWRKNTPQADKFFVQHLKGLGTSERADTIQYFKDLTSHLKKFKFSPNTPQLTENIFGPKQVPWRKKWLTERGDGDVQPLDYKSPVVHVDDFYNSELYEFSRSDIVRSIPSVIDGLKKSQRQALCGSLHHFEKTKNQKFKVAQLSGVVAAHTKYAHGEVSLQDTIVGMAQDFCGSNNMPLFNTQGAFGSRMQSGKDAASARYIYTSLRPYTRDIFNKNDDGVLKYTPEEGSRVQPDFYVPTVPLLLLNGAHGIGTGFATKLPCFKLEDIVRVVRARVRGEMIEEPLPHYNGYSANELTCSEPSKWTFTGKFERIHSRKIAITELPVGLSIEGYKEKVLDKLQDEVVKKVLVCHVDENTPRFEVELDREIPDDKIIGMFKLTSTITRNCMYFLDRHGKVKQYKTLVEIVDEWLKVKLEFTEKRRQSQIRANEEHLKDLELKIKFIRAVADDRIVIAKRTRENIRSQMQVQGIPQSHHEKFLAMSLVSISSERIAALESEAQTVRVTLGQLRGVTAKEMYLADLNNMCPDKHQQKRAREQSSFPSSSPKKQKVLIEVL